MMAGEASVMRAGYVRKVVIAIGVLATTVAIGILGARFGSRASAPKEANGCEISLDRIATLKGDEVQVGIVLFADDRIILGRTYDLAIFDERGRFLRTIGRQGEGPGEFGRIQQVLSMGTGRIGVLESNPPRLTIATLDGRVESTAQIPVLIDRQSAIVLDDGTVVASGTMTSRNQSGNPMVRFTLQGEVANFFGNDETESSGPLAGRMMPRVIAFHPRHGIAAVKQFVYDVELWTTEGVERGGFSPEVDYPKWPPTPLDPSIDAHVVSNVGPEEMVIGAQFDSHGFLWVLNTRADPEWSEAVDGMRVTNWGRFVDTQVDVFDPNSRRIVCSARFDNAMLSGFAGAGILASYTEDQNGEPVITLWRLRANSADAPEIKTAH